MSYDIPSVSELEAVQLLNKHYAEVITSKKDGIASGLDITRTTNPITGVTRRTLYKILDDAQAEHDAQISAHEAEHDVQISAHEAEHDVQISAHEAEHDAQMQSFENDFDGRLAGIAFTRVGSFTTGATLTDMRQVLVWEVSQGGDGHEYGWAGAFPKAVAAGATPATSGGIGAGAWVDRTDVTLRSEITPSVIESLRRSYAEAGYTLVAGSFEAGGTLVNANDVLLQERTGKAFSGPAGTVAAGTNPASGGFVDRSLRNWVQGGVSSPYQTYIYRHPNTPTLSVYSVAPQPMGAAPDFSIFTQIGSIEVDTFVQLQALSVPDGVKIKMNGYYNKGDVDQHPGFTVVADTTLYKDNFGAVVQLASGNYAVINSRSEVRATWMGVRTDPSYDNRERLVALGRATRNASALLDIRGAIHTSPVEYAYNSNLRGMESRGTQIKIYPLFPTPTQETYLFSDEYNPNTQTRDNNFFVTRSTFSIRPERRKNIGAYHFKAGGGSRLESLYIVDGGEGAATLLMSGTGASPSVTVESCWIGVTVRDGVSHNRNGVEIVSSYSVIFNQCTFDYLSDDRRMVNGVAVDNGNNDLTGGFAVYIRSCEGLTFQSANGEGNKKPFRIGNSVTVTISGGAFYRRSLNYSPSDEPDFFITLDDNSEITTPHIEKSMISGYKESRGGGVMRTINGGVLPVARQNEVYVGLYSPGQSAFQNVRTLQMVGKGSSVQAGVIGLLTQTFGKMVLSENVPPNTDASFDSKLNGAGMLIVTYQRISDNAFYGETQTYAYVGHNDSGVLTKLAGASTNASYTALNVSTFDSSNRRFIRVSVASKPWSATVSVFFIGCEYLL